MTTKEQLKMMEGWIKELNPNAFLHKADARCGERYAVATRKDGCLHTWTSYHKPDTLEAILCMAFHVEEFMKIKAA